jgi:hypothetical protein
MKAIFVGLMLVLLINIPSSAITGTITVYDNGMPDGVTGSEMTRWIEAEDFTLTSRDLISGVDFWAFDSGSHTGSIRRRETESDLRRRRSRRASIRV